MNIQIQKILQRITATCLSVALMIPCVSTLAVEAKATAAAAPPEKVEVTTDDYITVSVSTKNGGFLVDTVGGDKLNKGDDGKFLLYPDTYYDTSFTSFRVTDSEGKVNDYIFGREYGFMGMNSRMLSTEAVGNLVTSKWQLGELVFTQVITVLNEANPNHGMVGITYQVENTSPDGKTYDIQARVLLDTALGYQDYGYYQVPKTNAGAVIGAALYDQITYETILDNTDGKGYPNYFFSYDDPTNPKVRAYTVNANVGDAMCVPTKVAFGHWSNLASTMFDFTPRTGDDALNFTNPINLQHMTADSAYALYFDMGTVGAEETSGIATNYGVYSNITASEDDAFTMNVTEVPRAIDKELIKQEDGSLTYKDGGDFQMSFVLQNVTDQEIEGAQIQIIPDAGIYPYDKNGDMVVPETTFYKTPYTFELASLNSKGSQQVTVKFHAEPDVATLYKNISLSLVYGGTTLSEEVYVLCPGQGSSNIRINTTAPTILYKEGVQSLTISGDGIGMLNNKAMYSVKLTSRKTGDVITVAPDNIAVDYVGGYMQIKVNEEMALGQWDILIDWDDVEVADIQSSAMTFVVSDDPKYMPNAYGVVTIERDEAGGDTYSIKAYENEDAYEEEQKDPDNMTLLAFRGALTVERANGQNGEITEVIGASQKDSSGAMKNIMTVNDAIDVSNGTLTVKNSGGKITVDFQADLYTSGAGTKIWSGVSAITTIEDGTFVSLKWFDYLGQEVGGSVGSGDVNTSNSETLTLIWAGSESALQSIAGITMQMRFCEFGLMTTEYVGDEIGADDDKIPVISFGAQLSPDVLVPSNFMTTKREASAYENQLTEMSKNPLTSSDDLRDTRLKYMDAQEKHEDFSKGSLGLYVNNILFGNGGFIGFDTAVEVGIPSYIEGMPGVEGMFYLTVMNQEYAFGVEGSADFGVCTLEAALEIQSYNGIPVVDKLYFFAGGFMPGINPDTQGVFWIRGAGGGFDELYDTIFAASIVPPLTLLLSGEFAIFSTMSMRADLAMSMRGFSATFSDIGFGASYAQINVIDTLSIESTWYPEIRLYGGLTIDIKSVIVGEGYIVLEQQGSDFFWEGFARAQLQIPDDIRLIGGLAIGSASVGINVEKVWTAAEVVGVNFGLTYPWGGDVEFAFGRYNVPEPTYEMQNAITPLGVSSDLSLILDKTYADKQDIMAQVQFTAKDKATAQAILDEMSVTDEDGAVRVITWDAQNADGTLQNIAGANAFYTITETNGAATVSALYSFNKPSDFATDSADESTYKTWKFDFGTYASAVTDAKLEAISVERLPSLEAVSFDAGTNTVALAGDLTQFVGGNISLYAEQVGTDGNVEGLYLLKQLTDAEIQGNAIATADAGETDAATLSIGVTMPETLPSGTYRIKAVASDAKQSINPVVTADTTFAHTNPNAPTAPTVGTATLGGDYTIDVPVTPSTNAKGYIVNIYNADGSATDFTNMYLTEENLVNGKFVVGGRYTSTVYVDADGNEYSQVTKNADGTFTDKATGDVLTGLTEKQKTTGLEAGKSYTVGVTAYNEVSVGADGESTAVVTAPEVMSNAITMVAPTPVTIDFALGKASTMTNALMPLANADTGITATFETTTETNPTIQLSSTLVNAQYTLDGGDLTDIALTNGGATLQFEDLEVGMHVLYVRGENATGDAAQEWYSFAIDNVAPQLVITAPNAGSFFDENGVTITGISEKDATIKVSVEDEPKTTTTVTNDDGTFSVNLTGLDTSLAYQYVTLTATDALGNQSAIVSVPLIHEDLGKTKPGIYLGDTEITDTIVPDGTSGELSMKVKTAEGDLITINDTSLVSNSHVVYALQMVSGAEHVTLTDNNLTMAMPAIVQGLSVDVNGILTATFADNTYMAVLSGKDVVDKETIQPPEYTVPAGLTANYGDMLSTVTLPDGFAFEVADATTTPVGDAGNRNYTVSYTKDGQTVEGIRVTVRVAKMPLTLTVADATIKAGDALPTFTYTAKGFVNEETFASLNNEPVLSTTADGATAGTFDIVATLANTLTNYDVTFKYGTLTVEKVDVTITVENKTMYVRTAVPDFTYTVTGLIDGDSITTEPTFACDADGKTVGAYDITASGVEMGKDGATTSNYNITYKVGTLTVTDKKLQTLTLNPVDALTYGDADMTLSVATPTGTGAVTYTSSDDSILAITGDTATIKGVGEVTITATIAEDATYATASDTVTVTISTASADAIDLSDSITAPSKNTVPDTTAISKAQYTGTVTWDCDTAKFLGGTSYTATVKLTATGNYSLANLTEADFTVTGASSISYNADTQTLTVTYPATAARVLTGMAVAKAPSKVNYQHGEVFDPTGMTVTATFDDSTTDTAFADYTVDTTTALAVGTQSVTLTATADATITATQTVTVGKLTPEVTVSITNWFAGSTPSTPSATSTSGVTPTYAYYADANCTTVVADISTAEAGSYWLKATFAETDTYSAKEYVVAFIIATKDIVTEGDHADHDVNVQLDDTVTDALYDEVLTEEERKDPTSVKIALNVSVTTNATPEVTQKFDDFLAEYNKTQVTAGHSAVQAMLLDISLSKIIGENTTAIKTLNNPIKITIDIPKAYQNSARTFFVVRNHDGALEVLQDLDTNPNTITFATDRFSEYTLNYTEKVGVTGVTLDKETLALGVGAQATLTATVTPSDAANTAVTWATSDSTVATVDGAGNVTAHSAGKVTLTVTTTDGGYTATCDVRVTKNIPTLTATIADWTYGDTPSTPQATYTGDGDITYAFYTDAACTTQVDTTKAFGAGDYWLKASASATDTYAAVRVIIAVTVAKAPVTIQANSVTMHTGDALPSFTHTETGLVNGDTITNVSYDCTADGKTEGTYPITPQGAIISGGNDNYDITYTAGTLTVTDKQLQTITLNPVGALTYGDADVTLAISGQSGTGAVTYTSSDENVISISGNTATIKGAGSAIITATVAEDDTYATATTDITVTVAKATPSYTIPTDLTATYGDTLASITLPEGFTFEDVSNTKVGNAGKQRFTVTYTPEDSKNYNIVTGQTVTVDVAKAQATVTAQDAQMREGGVLPSFDYTITGLVAGDTVTTAPTYACDADVNVAGTYTVTPSAIAFADGTEKNYDITYVAGTLTVTNKLVQTITLNELDALTYGDAETELSISGQTGTGDVTYASSNPDVIAIRGNVAMVKGAGTAIITATVAADDTHETASATMTVTVAKASVTLTVQDASMTVGGTLPSFTYTATGFVGDETFITEPTLSVKTDGKTEGDFDIIAAGANVSDNYQISYTYGQLHVLAKGMQQITLNPVGEKQVGDAPFVLGITGALGTGSVTYVSSNPDVIIVVGNTATILGAGEATITATIAADANYASAEDSITVTVAKETPVATPTPVVTPQPTAEPTATPTATPTAEPTAKPTAEPTAEPTAKPTATPTVKPTAEPTVQPTAKPTAMPTVKPTAEPTVQPTAKPTATPTVKPTAEPTVQPTAKPTATPTVQPTAKPTATPTAKPTAEPTVQPTAKPTATPVVTPVITAMPTAEPTAKPTATPTATPTAKPTAEPTAKPTATPTAKPTAEPTAKPTAEPTAVPTVQPTAKPTATPTAKPTATPVVTPVVTATPAPTATVAPVATATPVITPVITAEPAPTATAAPVVAPVATQTPSVQTPQTGDATKMGGYIMLALASMGALGGLFAVWRKKRDPKE